MMAETDPTDAPKESPAPTVEVDDSPKVMAGLEGGNNPSRTSTSIFSSIANLFRDLKSEAESAGQEFQDLQTATKSTAAVDYTERLNRFSELQKDQQKLRSSAAVLAGALSKSATCHANLAERFKIEAKSFADKSAVLGSQDGVVNGLTVLESPKDGLEAERFAKAAARQVSAADALRKLQKTIEEFSQTMAVFHDKVLGDVYEAVKVYRRCRVSLDSAKPDADLLALQTATEKAKEAVDIKMLLLQEKRFRDLQTIAHVLETQLVLCIQESQAAFQ
jgi:hypothetical protein